MILLLSGIDCPPPWLPFLAAIIKSPALRHLEASSNNLVGSVPVIPSSNQEFSVLDLSNNQLTGTLPPALGSIMSLSTLLLADNQLTGELGPLAASLMPGNQILNFNVSGNKLSGPVPDQLALLRLFSRCLGGREVWGGRGGMCVCMCVGGVGVGVGAVCVFERG